VQLPLSVLADERVCENDELSHDGGERDFGLFAVCDEAVVEGLERGVEAGGGDRGHIERAPRTWARPPLMWRGPLLWPLSPVIGARPTIMAACLADKEPSSARPTMSAIAVTGSDARDGSQDSEPPGEARVGADQALDFSAKVFDRRFNRAELALDLDRRLPSRGRAELVDKGGSRGDGGVAAAGELVKAFHERAGRWGRVGLEAFGEDRQHPAVDAVGFGQGAHGLGEQPRTQRIDDGVGMEAAVGGAVKLARRLHRCERDLVGGEATPSIV
jgi:hypothetical protein